MIVSDAWLTHLCAQIPRVRAGNDAESVHQLRVAAGRLSVWLELGGRKILRDDLRALRQSAASVRDFDVLIASGTGSNGANVTGWSRELRDERRRCAGELAARLSSERLNALLFGLSVLPPLDEATARRSIEKLEKRALAAGSKLEEQRGDTHALHRLRRALRKLRYAREWLGENVDELKALQDELGDVQNHAVRLRHIEESPMRAELEELRVESEREMEAGTRRALLSWPELEKTIRGDR